MAALFGAVETHPRRPWRTELARLQLPECPLRGTQLGCASDRSWPVSDRRLQPTRRPSLLTPSCRIRLTAFGCGLNWSVQHLISNYREEDVENEAATEDLLQRGSEGDDVGSMAARRVATQYCSPFRSRSDQSDCNQRAAASAVSSGRVLNAMEALGAALRTALMTISNRGRLFGGSLMPPPITTQS
jgi:hypothetical protein